MFTRQSMSQITEVKPVFRYLFSILVIFALLFPAAYKYAQNEEPNFAMPIWFGYFVFGLILLLGTIINSSERHPSVKNCVIGAAGIPGMLYAAGFTTFSI